MTFMTPDEYEKLQALNAWTGRSDLVGLRLINKFNQSVGHGHFKQNPFITAKAGFQRVSGTPTPC
jgi:hypothetical protein